MSCLLSHMHRPDSSVHHPVRGHPGPEAHLIFGSAKSEVNHQDVVVREVHSQGVRQAPSSEKRYLWRDGRGHRPRSHMVSKPSLDATSSESRRGRWVPSVPVPRAGISRNLFCGHLWSYLSVTSRGLSIDRGGCRLDNQPQRL